MRHFEMPRRKSAATRVWSQVPGCAILAIQAESLLTMVLVVQNDEEPPSIENCHRPSLHLTSFSSQLLVLLPGQGLPAFLLSTLAFRPQSIRGRRCRLARLLHTLIILRSVRGTSPRLPTLTLLVQEKVMLSSVFQHFCLKPHYCDCNPSGLIVGVNVVEHGSCVHTPNCNLARPCRPYSQVLGQSVQSGSSLRSEI